MKQLSQLSKFSIMLVLIDQMLELELLNGLMALLSPKILKITTFANLKILPSPSSQRKKHA